MYHTDYIINLHKLRQLIIEQGIEIHERKSPKSGGCYHSDFLGLPPEISLDGALQPCIMLAVLAHEYGHHLDTKSEKLMPRELYNLGGWLKNKGLVKIGRFLLGKSVAEIVTREEKAWDLGFQYLRDHGIQPDYSMEWERKRCVQSYRDYAS